MHSLEAQEFRYLLPLSSTICTVLPLTKPGVASEHEDGFKQMNAYREDHFVKIPLLSPHPDDTDDADVTSGPDDSNDSEYKPPRRSGLEETMDELNMFLMYIHGITPEMAAERRQKEIEREEQAAQEVSGNKVMEWRNHLDVY